MKLINEVDCTAKAKCGLTLTTFSNGNNNNDYGRNLKFKTFFLYIYFLENKENLHTNFDLKKENMLNKKFAHKFYMEKWNYLCKCIFRPFWSLNKSLLKLFLDKFAWNLTIYFTWNYVIFQSLNCVMSDEAVSEYKFNFQYKNLRFWKKLIVLLMQVSQVGNKIFQLFGDKELTEKLNKQI